MSVWHGPNHVPSGAIGSVALTQIYVGNLPMWAGIDADFRNVGIPAILKTNWGSASSGDNRLIAVSDGDDGRVYARMKAGELPVVGARRCANWFPDLGVATWSGTSALGGVTPVRTASYLTDPVIGRADRVQIDASAATASGYGWTYRLCSLTVGRRYRIAISCWLKSNTELTYVVGMPPGLGISGTAPLTVTPTWTRFTTFYSAAAGGSFAPGIGLMTQGPGNAGGLTPVVDVLIAMSPEYAPMVEIMSDELLPRPQVSPTTSYGFGANGVKYFQHRPSVPINFSLSGITFYDFFDRADTANGTLGTAPVGSLAWSMRGPYNGSAQPAISLGRITSKRYVIDSPAIEGIQAVYAYQHLRGTVRRLGAVISYAANTVNVGGNGYVWTYAIGGQDPIVNSMIHFRGTHQTWLLDLWFPDGSIETIASGTLPTQMAVTGKAYYVEILFNEEGDEATLIFPGDRIVIRDSRMGALLGDWVFFEQFVNGPSSNLLRYHAVWAVEDGQSAIASNDYAKWEPNPTYPVFRPLPALTQAVLWSADFSNAAWVKTNSTATEQLLATQPKQKLAEQKVWKIFETTANGLHGVSQATGIGAVQQTATFIVKAAERTRVQVRINNATDGDVALAIFDIAIDELPTVVSGTGVIDRSMKDNVYILSVTGTPTVTGSFMFLELVSTGTTTSYVGVATSGVLLYYGGAEAGAAFSAPIVTGASSVARLISTPSLGAVAHGTAWTWIAEILVPVYGIVNNERIIGTSDASDKSVLQLTTTGRAQAYNGTTVLETATGLLPAGRHKVAVRRDGANGAIFVDGVKRVDSAFDFALAASPVTAIGGEPDGSGQGNVHVLGNRYFTLALIDADLVARTSNA